MRHAPVLALLMAACGFGDKSAEVPGTDLGTFHVVASLASNTCGEGAVYGMETWKFDVRLSRSDREIYWDSGGEVVTGEIDEDRESFSIVSSVLVDMRDDSNGWLPDCSIERSDTARGSLDSHESATSFEGSLSYDYAPTPKSDCTDLVGPDGALFEALPCSFSYDVIASKD